MEDDGPLGCTGYRPPLPELVCAACGTTAEYSDGWFDRINWEDEAEPLRAACVTCKDPAAVVILARDRATGSE